MKDVEKMKQELADVFNPELAMASYIPFLRIFGKQVSILIIVYFIRGHLLMLCFY